MDVQTNQNWFSGMIYSMVIPIALSMTTASFAVFVTKERTTKAKQVTYEQTEAPNFLTLVHSPLIAREFFEEHRIPGADWLFITTFLHRFSLGSFTREIQKHIHSHSPWSQDHFFYFTSFFTYFHGVYFSGGWVWLWLRLSGALAHSFTHIFLQKLVNDFNTNHSLQ